MSLYKDSMIQKDQDRLKQGMVKVLGCVATISSAAAVINPIFGVAGSLIRVALAFADNEEINNLKREFGSVHSALDKLSEQNRVTLQEIQKQTVDQQYGKVERNLRNQFRKYKEVLDAPLERRERKIIEFKESYRNDLRDQNLNTLYDGVMGKPKLFSRPILEVYMEHSQGNRQVMERLCTHLTYLFCIGLIAFMGYTAVIKNDEEAVVENWSKKMEQVQERMQEVLKKCK